MTKVLFATESKTVNLQPTKNYQITINNDTIDKLGEISKNGYEALKTMFYDHKMFPESVYIISSNPVGIKNIQGLLIEQDYFNVNYDGRTFVKR